MVAELSEAMAIDMQQRLATLEQTVESFTSTAERLTTSLEGFTEHVSNIEDEQQVDLNKLEDISVDVDSKFDTLSALIEEKNKLFGDSRHQ